MIIPCSKTDVVSSLGAGITVIGEINFMRVSVVIANKNYADLLWKAIDSGMYQDYEDVRVVVVDDCSQDVSVSELGPFEELIDIIKLPSSVGPGAARNIGIRSIWDDTDVFAFLDSDDEYLSGKISKSVQYFQDDKDIGLVYTDEIYEDVDTSRIITVYHEPFSYDRLLNRNIIGANFMVTKAALAKFGLFDESMPVAENYDLAWRIASRSAVIHIPEPLVHVRLTKRALRNTVPRSEWARCSEYIMGKTS